MFFQLSSSLSSPPASPPVKQALRVTLALVLLSLPNLFALFFAENYVLARLLMAQGLGLMLLPAAIGLSLRRTLLIWSPMALLVPASVLYLLQTGHLPNEWTVLVMAEASTDELSSFAAACIVIAVTTPLLVAAIWRLLAKDLPENLQLTRLSRLLVLALSLLLPALELTSIGLSFGWEPSLNRLRKTFPFSVCTSLIEATRVKHQLANRQELTHHFKVAATPAEMLAGQRDIHLLFLGETCRFDSFSIHGYDRPTSPQLEQQPGLLDFVNVVAPAPYTTLSVPMLLTAAEPGTQHTAAMSPSIINVFKQAGYRTYWVSTQKKHGFGDTSCSLYAQDADESQFLSGIIDATGTGSYASAMDSELIPAVKEILSRNEPRVLILCHGMGSHSNYADRYPAHYERYPVDLAACPVARRKTTLSAEDRLNLRNAYDNSIHFTDHVITALIGVLNDQPLTAASFCFVPDHGENSGEAQVLPFAHGNNTVDVLHVPMFMWFSKGYQQIRPQQVSQLQSRVASRFSSANLFHTLIDVAGLNCTLLEPSKSLSHASYLDGPRAVVGGDGEKPVNYEDDVLALETGRKGWRPMFPKRQTAQR